MENLGKNSALLWQSWLRQQIFIVTLQGSTEPHLIWWLTSLRPGMIKIMLRMLFHIWLTGELNVRKNLFFISSLRLANVFKLEKLSIVCAVFKCWNFLSPLNTQWLSTKNIVLAHTIHVFGGGLHVVHLMTHASQHHDKIKRADGT